MTSPILAGGGTPIEGGEPGAIVVAAMIALWWWLNGKETSNPFAHYRVTAFRVVGPAGRSGPQWPPKGAQDGPAYAE